MYVIHVDGYMTRRLAILTAVLHLEQHLRITYVHTENKAPLFGYFNRKEVLFWKLSLSINWEEFTIEEEVKDRKRLTVRSVNNRGKGKSYL